MTHMETKQRNRADSKGVGGSSPWGKIDHVDNEHPGIQFCQTPSHGGYYLSRETNEKVHPAWRFLVLDHQPGRRRRAGARHLDAAARREHAAEAPGVARAGSAPVTRGDNSAWWDACEAHEWIHVGDELTCQRCGCGYPKRDPLVVGILVAIAIVFLIGAGVAVVWWLRECAA